MNLATLFEIGFTEKSSSFIEFMLTRLVFIQTSVDKFLENVWS